MGSCSAPIDFTSSHYLGLRHPSNALRPWESLTSGKPAALWESPETQRLSGLLARLQGCERATLAPSTLHVFWDLFAMFDCQDSAIYVDGGTYPVARWGVERAAGRGIPVRSFIHHDPVDLRRHLWRDRGNGRAPVLVTDGFCASCGRAAPLPEYFAAVRGEGGQLVIDDSQSLGILGEQPSAHEPYGRGGGGSLRWYGLGGADVVVASSMAKAFGVPIAVLAGSNRAIASFEDRSQTRVHSSPPSVAALRATERALVINQRCGETLRRRLCGLVRLFRTLLGRVGLTATGGIHPVQTIRPRVGQDVVAQHRQLTRAGIETVLRRDEFGEGARVGVLITARHQRHEIERAVAALASTAPRNRRTGEGGST